MPLGRIVAPAVVELTLGPLVSKAIKSDFLVGDTGTVGLEDVEVEAGIEIPTTEDVGRVLRVAEPEDGEGVGERRSSAHDFLTFAGAGGGARAAETTGAGLEVWIVTAAMVVIRPS
jgi:hypothetical protein